MDSIDLALQKIRQDGDIELRSNELVTDAFISNPPHRVGIYHLALKPRFLLADPTGSGKSQPLDSSILLATGWKSMRDIQVGDKVISVDGTHSSVMSIHPQGLQPTYEVLFSDGTSTECSKDHIWTVQPKEKRSPWRDMTVEELIAEPSYRRYRIPLTDPVQFRSEALSIDPYLLGVILGDGCISSPWGVMIGSSDEEILRRVRGVLPSDHRLSYKSGYDYRIVSDVAKFHKGNKICNALRDLGLQGTNSETKFIPEVFLFSSESQRTQLLAGLLDTDGSIDEHGTVEFSSNSEALVKGVIFLVQSLGGTARVFWTGHKTYTYKGEKKIGKLHYRVLIHIATNPFILQRKWLRHDAHQKHPIYRYIRGITYIGEKESQCIRIDHPSGLYLTNDFIVTHNTPQLLVGYAFLKVKSPKHRLLVMAPKSALFQWQDSVHRFLNGVTAEVVGYDSRTGTFKNRAYRHSVYRNSKSDVLLLSYHTMARDIDEILAHIEDFVVVMDEIQTIKSRNQRLLYPASLKLSQKARYTWGASATPIMNRLEELFAIINVLIPGFFGDFNHFKRCYYDYRQNAKGQWEHVGYKNLSQLMHLIRPFYLKRPANEINQHLPEIVMREVLVDMEGEQEATYKEIIRSKFPGTEEMKARKLTRLASLTYAQIVSDAPAVLNLNGGSSKTDELIRLLTDELSDQKVIVYTRFEMVITYLSGILKVNKIKFERITGKEDPLQRNRAKNTFNSSPDVNVILINDAGGEAIELASAGIIVFFELPFSWGKFTQIIGRARRRGSAHKHLLILLLMNRGTVDEKTYRILQVKEKLVSRTFGVDDEILGTGDLEKEEDLNALFDAVRDQEAADSNKIMSLFPE